MPTWAHAARRVAPPLSTAHKACCRPALSFERRAMVGGILCLRVMVRVREFESYVSATQLSERLGGRLVPSALRYRARAGMIPGAIKIGSRMFFPPRAVDALIEDLCSPRVTQPVFRPRRGHTTLDGPLDVER